MFLRNRSSSHCHLDNIHGGGASPLRRPVHSRLSIQDARGIVNGYDRRISGCRAAQGHARPGQAAVARWKRCRVPRLSIQLMSLVSSVSHELMDSCEIERNPISLAAVRALGEAHLKCCMQMYYALALITRGSVRTLIRSVEETNKTEAWRLIQSRYAPDTQNRQYALMQKIMMLAKPGCDHTEGFESGLRSWELDVGEWERASGTALADAVLYTVMMYMAPIFLRNSLLGTYANSTALRAALLQWCYSSRNFGANPTASSGNGTSADFDRMQVDSLKIG